MSSLRKYLPNLRRQRSSEDAATTTSEEQVDVKREKSAGDSDSEDLVVDPATAADPELNPGGLSLEEGVYFIRTFRATRRCSTCAGRCGWWHGSPSRCLQLHTPHVRMLSLCLMVHILTAHHSVGRIIGTGIFSTPSSILGSVGSVGASLMLWVLGFVLSLCGLFIWLEFGTMFPRSGGEKVYLEAVYKKPKYLVTIIFAANAIILGFTAAGCIVSSRPTIDS